MKDAAFRHFIDQHMYHRGQKLLVQKAWVVVEKGVRSTSFVDKKFERFSEGAMHGTIDTGIETAVLFSKDGNKNCVILPNDYDMHQNKTPKGQEISEYVKGLEKQVKEYQKVVKKVDALAGKKAVHKTCQQLAAEPMARIAKIEEDRAAAAAAAKPKRMPGSGKHRQCLERT